MTLVRMVGTSNTLADLASELGGTLDEKAPEASEAPVVEEPESESEKAGM